MHLTLKPRSSPALLLVAVLTMTACTADGGEPLGETTLPAIEVSPQRYAYFGDLHVHTNYSYDAFLFGTRATPDDAYRFAQGESLPHPAGFDIQLDRPLDFYAVTDHASFLGMMRAMLDSE